MSNIDPRDPFRHNDDYIRIKDFARLAAEFGDSDKVDTSLPFKENYKQVKNSFQSEIVIAAYLRRYIELFNQLVDEFNDHVQIFNQHVREFNEFTIYVDNNFEDIYNNLIELESAINDLSGRVDDHDTLLDQLRDITKDLENSIQDAMSREVVSASYDKNTQYLTLTKSNGSEITTTIPQFDDSALIELIQKLNSQILGLQDQIAELQNQVSGGTTLQGEVNSVGGQLQAIGIDINGLSYGGGMIYNKLSGGGR